MRGSYVSTRPVANSYLVRERDRRRVRELLAVLLLVPPAAGLLGNIWLRGQVVRTGYEITDRERELVELERVKQRLELEWSVEAAPAKVEQRARELGMIEPGLEQVVRLEETE